MELDLESSVEQRLREGKSLEELGFLGICRIILLRANDLVINQIEVHFRGRGACKTNFILPKSAENEINAEIRPWSRILPKSTISN